MINPFEQAKAKMNDSGLGDIGYGNPTVDQSPQTGMINQQDTNTLKNAYIDWNDFKEKDLPTALNKVGLSDLIGRISFSNYGKIQLQSALMNKFGVNYLENPDAKKIMTTFDNFIKDNKIDVFKETSKLNNGAARTLKELL